MPCVSCGTDAAPGARFCAGCGARLPETALARRPEPLTESAAVAAPGIPCPACQQRTMPVPYFSRGINVAKMAVLLPFTFVGPALFFLLRKDRMVCMWCRGLLPGDYPVGIFEAFSSTPPPAALARMPEGARQGVQALMVHEQQSREVADLERHSRSNRVRSWMFGGLTALAGGFAALALGTGGEEPAAFFATFGTLTGLGSWFSASRARKLGEAASSKRDRRRMLDVLDLARKHDGRLTVTLVASKLGLDFKEAEALLDGMLDGRRVDVQADEHGRVVYVFPEIAHYG